MKIVLATFGSRGDVQPMLALSLALQSAGHRVLLAAPPEKGEWARQMGCVHLKLFPRMAAVIHHGGAGTVATSAISGVPQIVVPHLLDQYY